MPPTTTSFPSLQVLIGAGPAARSFEPGLPVLGGEQTEQLFTTARSVGQHGDLALFQAGPWLVGAATLPLSTGLEETSRQIYEQIFQATRDLHLTRVWNYIPAINEAGPDGLENYRIFCRGRSLAYEQHYGRDFNPLLPSASAVGSKSATLTVVFVATAAVLRHLENPLQVPAYEYPDEYGPRSPSFARATVVSSLRTAFISGTAAIRGHATVTPHQLLPQLDCTLENLREISIACGLGPALGRGTNDARRFKVYLRHASDQPHVAAVLQEKLLTPTDHISYLQADICRAGLLVEIEATLPGFA